MKRLFLSMLLLSALIIGAGDAIAADNVGKPGLYGSLGVSHVTLQDATFTDSTGSAEAEFDGGYGIMAALGYRFNNNFRAEGEISYRHNDVDNVDGTQFSGDAKSWAFMANGYYDFVTGGSIQPYLGAGFGVAHEKIKGDGTAFFADGTDTVLAYQAIAGVAVPVASDTSVGFEYRYFGTQDPEDDGVETEYGTHNIGVRLNHSF